MEATTNKTWFTKTIARETLEATAADLLKNGSISIETANALNALFAGKSRVGGSNGSNILVKDENGNVVFKRCSYFGLYLPVADFGTVGTSENGEVKLSYQSKLAATKQREAKTALAHANYASDKRMEEEKISIPEWKAEKALNLANSEMKAEYDGDSISFTTYEGALEEV
jgi:hypothetical protein